MANEIASFSVLRPFQKRDKNATRAKVVQSYSPTNNSPFYQDLKASRTKNDRDGMIAKAKAFRDGVGFLRDFSKIGWPLEQFDQWLAGNEKNVSAALVQQKVGELFKAAGVADWKAWLGTNAYTATVGQLSDSLIASAIGVGDEPLVQKLRPRFVRSLRICKLVERLGAADAELNAKSGIAKAMSALVLLPKDIFPVPPRDLEKEKQVTLGGYEKTKNETLEKQKRVIGVIDEIGKLREAKTEINKLHRQTSRPDQEAERENRIKTMEKAKKDRGFGLRSLFTRGGSILHDFQLEKDTSWQLSPTAQKQVSAQTKKTLDDLGASIENTDVRTATTEIERKVSVLSQSLNIPGSKSTTVKIGNNFISKGFIVPASAPGVRTVQPTSGTVDIKITTPTEPPVVAEATVPTGKGDVQPVGYSDLYVIREQLQKYVAGEVAHIENILKGEDKEREHRRLTEREDIIELEREQLTETERDLQSTSRFDLQLSGQQAIQEHLSVQAGVSGSYSSPSYEVKANAGFAYDRAVQESSTKASNVSHEVVDKTVSKTQERVREARRRRLLERIEETNTHRIKNSEKPAGHIVGIYRWVNEIHKVEVVNIGRRLMYEFIVPEPAAFYKHSQTLTPIEGVTLEKPEPPIYEPVALNSNSSFLWRDVSAATEEIRPLEPRDLSEENYMHWVAKYNVQDASAPPPEFKVMGVGLNEKPASHDNLVIQNLGELTVEEGYEAESAYVGGSLIPHDKGYLRVSVGRNVTELRGGSPVLAMNGESGKIAITAIYYAMAAIGVTVEVTSRRSEAKFSEWKLKTFASIMNAYNDLKSRYDEQVTAAQTAAGVVISGRNPLKNREIEQAELKKLAVSIITGQQFDLFDAMRQNVAPNGYPQMDIGEASREGRYIQFFEQALEWHNMSYVLYPYFWSRKQHWIEMLNLLDTDPKFEKFLQAGAARVLVPVRPGYEQALLHYFETESGEIWDGGDPPHVDDDLYVPIVDAIKEEQGQFTVEGAGELTLTKDSDVIKGSGTAFTPEDDENREIVIKGKTYRIKKVDGLDSITLDSPYAGNGEAGVPYELGVKYVGQPWEITVPTSLIWLQEKPDLPDFTKP